MNGYIVQYSYIDIDMQPGAECQDLHGIQEHFTSHAEAQARIEELRQDDHFWNMTIIIY